MTWPARSIRIAIATTVIGAVPIAVLAIVTTAVAERAVRHEVGLRLQVTAAAGAQRIDEAVAAAVRPVEATASHPSIVGIVSGRLDGSVNDARARAAIEPALARASVLGAFLADAQGDLLATVGVRPPDELRKGWTDQLSDERTTAVSDAVVDGTAEPVAAILSRVPSMSAEAPGVFGVIVDLHAIQAYIDRDATSKDVVLTVMDRQGTIVAGPDQPTPAHQLLGAESTSSALGWRVLAETPERLALAGLGEVRNTVIGVVTFLTIGLALVVALVVRADRRRRRAEIEWRTAHDRATDASIHKSEFLANMSHEIRTPLNGVIGLTTLLVDSDLTPDQRELAEMAHRSGEALLEIINDILDFSRVEAGRLTVEVIDFDLRSLVEDVSHLLAASAETKHIELLCAIEDDVPARLRGDPTRIRQVLTNLAGNAVKFTDEGSVVLRAGIDGGGGGPIVARIEVVDTGPGIPESARAHLFDPFTQADASMTRRFGGSGLGLSISERLVQLMGGEIGFDSDPGHGSTFWFTVPLAPATEPSPVMTPASVAGLRVLIVDDNDLGRQVLERLVLAGGMIPRAARNGSEALETLHQLGTAGELPDLVLLDLNMPDLDGFAVTAEVRRIHGPEPRIVLLTSSAQRGEARRGQEAGIDGYLSKPVRQSELFEVAAMVMGRPEESHIVTRHVLREARGDRPRPSILLAEDNPVNQRVASAMLERLGYRVEVATTGIEAVTAARAQPYVAILMDCQMPEMDGFEATRLIRAEEGTRTPIIALTASATEADREACLAAGMDDHIAKPLQPSTLQLTLDRWVAGPAPTPDDADPSTESATIDNDVVASLLDIDEGSLLTSLVEIFEADSSLQLESMRSALNLGDLATVRSVAHRLKGGAATIGAIGAAEAFVRLEHAAEANRPDTAAVLLVEAERLVDESVARLRARGNSTP